ncbi:MULTISPECIES: aminotransferase-like domain-containing protein [unclassified Agarivorans]|nr:MULTISPECIES: PLP-dependent aminotransferase family protein [unclassified Agarivorans]MDO6684504.1 PLP-dependent aminotransferase family protein [Agarivorans sp. 3_MG-2023]MDO6714669.1 PLP-dependent aminotransferase family protein [Agarivorans sp. 2_MG-2023]
MMTIWQELEIKGNKAAQIVEQIRTQVEQQHLQAGDKLPPQRHLAEHLAVTVGTISRAYAQAEQQGLIESKTGSGSYVKSPTNYQQQWGSLKGNSQHIELWQNTAFTQSRAQHLTPLLQSYSLAGDQLDTLLDNDHSQNLPSQREAVCQWLNQQGGHFKPEQLFFSYGAQHGLNLCLIAMELVGERLLCEALCYPGLITLAKQLKIELKGVTLDDDGICPNSLLNHIEKYHPKALYLTPTLQNPTTAIMSQQRRQQIIDICQQHQVIIIEDDVCGLLPDQRPKAFVELAPEQVIYLNSFSKGAFKGLRFAYLHAPQHLQVAINSAIRGSTWNISPLLVDVAIQWIQAGLADKALLEQRRLVGQRAQLLHHYMAGLDYTYQEGGLHCWLRLPASWRCAQFVEAAQQQGVEVASAEHFVVDNQASPNAVRISLGQAESNQQLDQGLAILAKLLKTAPQPSQQII